MSSIKVNLVPLVLEISSGLGVLTEMDFDNIEFRLQLRGNMTTQGLRD